MQTGVKVILEAIYEQDFLACSYGYRPKTGATKALEDLYQELREEKYHYIVEADIKGYFENIDHEILIQMLNQRIDDKSFIRLIRKWLKAGILDTFGKVICPATGTPQGGIIKRYKEKRETRCLMARAFNTIYKTSLQRIYDVS